MVCCLCNEKEGIHKYELIDRSTVDICDDCGKIVYGIEFKPAIPDRLFHIIAMLKYVKDYKQSTQKVLVKKPIACVHSSNL